MVSCPCPPISTPGDIVSEDLPKPPSPGSTLNPVKGPRMDEGPLKSSRFLQNSNSGHSLAVASVATHWGKSVVPSGVLMSLCDDSLIDQGPATAEPGRLHLPPTAEALRFLLNLLDGVVLFATVSDAGVVFLQYLLNYLPDEDY
ncbi:hypothetical protein Nepgr_017991 [Nepenthes gracilis]|uniref:Uncharacterized protein n=1 Tax=Nepenthes gracilis TaxID=150966 RepID=A0AAD3SSH1_NEPGR|nr:hypothetical protein Nepgr_017991 [Nepenthes gracilis]